MQINLALNYGSKMKYCPHLKNIEKKAKTFDKKY